MDSIWQRVRNMYRTNESARSSPRMADVAMEVLQNLGEEAKDVVYYEALNRVHGEKNTGQGEREPNKWSAVRRRVTTSIRSNSVFGINGTQEQDTRDTTYFPNSNSFVGNILSEITRLYSRLRLVVVDPESDLYYFWMGTAALAVLYNFWVIILRVTFPEMRDQTAIIAWMFVFFDLLADAVYILDIAVQFHTAYLEDGIIVREQAKLWTNYRQKPYFLSDVIAILPLSFIFGFLQNSLIIQVLRIPRLCKWHTISDMFEMSDSRTSRPYGVRALKLTIYLAIIIHWFACFYFMICEYEGFGSTAWTYPELKGNDDRFARKYIKSLFWAALTLTTIGENESPETTLEYVFTGCTFLIGVLLFATIVGNMGDVISSMNATRAEFQERMDGIKSYMEHHEIPVQLQDRVKRWSQYSWSRTKALEEETTLGFLPHRLRTEIAIHVHLETLKKVKIFKDCEQGFLCELVLKLRSQIFSPEDYICRIGEIGREMYIINNGKVEIVVRDSSSGDPIVVASLSDGNYFGEISLLRLDGGTNRRTADVRSVGYSELLCLSKKDLMEALKEYPEAQEILEAQGRDRLQRTKTEKNAIMRMRESNKKTEGEDIHSIGDGVRELKRLVEQLKCFDKLEVKLESKQLQNQCDALSLQVKEQEMELKRSRKRSYNLERMLLCRKNGFYNSTGRFEEQATSSGEKLLDLSDHPTTNHKGDEPCGSIEGTNHVRDEFHGDMGRPNHVSESPHDQRRLTKNVSFLTRTSQTTDVSERTRTNHMIADDSYQTEKPYERTSEVSNNTRKREITYKERNMTNSRDTACNHTTAQTNEDINTSSSRTNETDLGLKVFCNQAGSHKDTQTQRVFEWKKEAKHNSVCHVNPSQRRSSV
ncbi:cyclic nucleotide-gated cation channel alpha-3-like [Dendronephthya gigantea]|uniref:cyclic nucleotide-gated cation channel alpha-3-like n=1 Tax=Dendronephthya gigantea TaxID=151771 RepID=UPI00106AA5E7|nr:cyclic nucleotide-gated cation channel alpha-3-like [Dendronephthya gigantea]XP_028409064.1 cyclic nucleotide-gated cation channel alpha-3-like [Dendronephthya gigantea]XP_028409065.1 cyclic nucleotide-gated cation channel alpha-3-like [Dendronephthya gigantea]XP_028409066.1 cyclic nucleotide-gated cation channel alpha-3-like [Dendronephthya gigantea]